MIRRGKDRRRLVSRPSPDALRTGSREHLPLWAASSHSGWLSDDALITHPFELLVVVGLSLIFRGDCFLAGLSIGFLHLTRGEGVLLLGVAGLHRSLAADLRSDSGRRGALRELVLLAAGFAVRYQPVARMRSKLGHTLVIFRKRRDALP